MALRDMKCTVHNLEVMSLNPGRVELGVCSTSRLYLKQKIKLLFEQHKLTTAVLLKGQDCTTTQDWSQMY